MEKAIVGFFAGSIFGGASALSRHAQFRRLLRQMGLEAIYQKPNLSKPAPNQVWSTDITYIRLRAGFIYLVVVMDWFSRYVLSWEISTSLDATFAARLSTMPYGMVLPQTGVR